MQAREVLDQAIAVLRETGNRKEEAMALNKLGKLLSNQGVSARPWPCASSLWPWPVTWVIADWRAFWYGFRGYASETAQVAAATLSPISHYRPRG